MATTTKKPTSRAKTKTSKAKATKKTAPKRTTAAKTATQKTMAKEVVAKKVQPAKKAIVTLQTLRRLNAAAAGLFLVLAAVAGFMMNSTSYQLTLGHLAKDEIASKSETVLAPAVQAVYDVEVRWLVVGLLLLSAALPILYLTKLQNRYSDYLTKSRMLPLRWVDYAVTGAVIAEVVALLSGVSDIATLKLAGGLVAATAILGLIAERQNNVSDKPVRSAYYTGLLTGILFLAFIAAYAVSTVVYGTSAVPWHVYALYATVLVGFALQARNQHMEYGRGDYLVVERNYVVINTLTKVAFAAILIVGLAR